MARGGLSNLCLLHKSLPLYLSFKCGCLSRFFFFSCPWPTRLITTSVTSSTLRAYAFQTWTFSPEFSSELQTHITQCVLYTKMFQRCFSPKSQAEHNYSLFFTVHRQREGVWGDHTAICLYSYLNEVYLHAPWLSKQKCRNHTTSFPLPQTLFGPSPLVFHPASLLSSSPFLNPSLTRPKSSEALGKSYNSSKSQFLPRKWR